MEVVTLLSQPELQDPASLYKLGIKFQLMVPLFQCSVRTKLIFSRENPNFFSVNMKTLSAHLADSNSRPIQTLKKPVSVSSAITNTFQATNPASSNSVKIVKYPHVISAEKGVVEITVHYTATTPAYISSSMFFRNFIFSRKNVGNPFPKIL